MLSFLQNISVVLNKHPMFVYFLKCCYLCSLEWLVILNVYVYV